ncbi:MAG: UDP-N-acetylmuramoyl-L-alanyl-D-glutamate--2,6-diaminopimelate ligase [Lachnospiraceae bacterium]|nr:UDP-N-acetylmuramoyl-L-alanyl-D-glutamate--2,6-diaminopimelate ligase [Lachnospiraceae bacterium]
MILHKEVSFLLDGLTFSVLQGSTDVEITDIVNDSRKAVEGCLFFCIVGNNFDGHDMADEVAAKGARVLIVSRPVAVPESVTVILVEDTRYAMAFIAAAYYDHPADKLKTIGVTGTKGKTTTTYLVKSVLEHAGHRVGLIGTIEEIIGEAHIHAGNTTPESCLLQEYFARMVDEGLDTVVMEVSSQALMLHRTQGFLFDYGVFTNLEPDHIGPGEHESFEDYLHCKSLLFQQCRMGIANGDDAHTAKVMENRTCELFTYGFDETNDLRAKNVELVKTPGQLGVAFDVEGTFSDHVQIAAPGRFSVYNALAAISICLQFGVSHVDIKEALLRAKVKGRIEMVPVSDEFTLMIDYAHNAMALESLYSTLKEYHPKRLVSVFGCGGNRSKLRRYEMGEVSGRLADFTIVTSDNPRFEEPMDIIADIRSSIEKTGGEFIEICDRKEAIRYAIHHGQSGDIIVLAGKGHEDYQEIRGVKYPMDERVLIQEILEEDRLNSAGKSEQGN